VKGMVETNTVLFEDKYKVKIKDFSTTCEIDEFVAKKTGKKSLRIAFVHTDIISARGAIIPLVDTNINARFDKAIKK
jgi:hypothetical protein